MFGRGLGLAGVPLRGTPVLRRADFTCARFGSRLDCSGVRLGGRAVFRRVRVGDREQLVAVAISPDEGRVARQYVLVNGGDRVQDPLVGVDRFADEVLVRCPACDGCAVVLDHPVGRRRLSCLACGLVKDAFSSAWIFGIPEDPWFRLPLWLRADCCDEVLWAYNAEHLDLLESYVAARLRERRASPGSMSMLARLPAWLKSAKNRDEVLRAIRRLRSTLPTARG